MPVNEKKFPSESVHAVLAHSYMSYFVSFLLGLFFHLLYPVKIYDHPITAIVGFVFLALATVLILWAQRSSRKLHEGQISKDSFCRGPYCYTRIPTQWGLLFLMLGFGLMINSLFVVLCTIIFFFVSKTVFIKKEEDILIERYGKHYLEYKKSVRL